MLALIHKPQRLTLCISVNSINEKDAKAIEETKTKKDTNKKQTNEKKNTSKQTDFRRPRHRIIWSFHGFHRWKRLFVKTTTRKDDNTKRRQNDKKRPFVDEQRSLKNNAFFLSLLYTHRALL